jgi:hypothetical protein
MPPAPLLDQCIFDDAELTISQGDPLDHQCEEQQKKSVRFDLQHSIVHTIPNLDDFSKEEISQTWYNRAEFRNIKKSCIATIRLQKTGFYLENDLICYRGFELRQLGETSRRRVLDKIKAETAVLVEQERQRSSGIRQSQVIADIYRSFTIHCRLHAFRVGMQDVDVANGIYYHNAQQRNPKTANNESQPGLVEGVSKASVEESVQIPTTEQLISFSIGVFTTT